MDCWDFLGLEPNVDAKTVKLAYSKLLKEIRPEEDPDGFQKLREAYKSALESLKTNTVVSGEENTASNSTVPNVKSAMQSDDKLSTEYTANTSSNSTADTTSSTSLNASANLGRNVSIEEISLDKEFDEFIADAKGLVKHPEKVNLLQEWRELLTSSVVVDLEYSARACDRIFCLIADFHLDRDEKTEPTIDVGVLVFLNEEFKWEEKRYDLYSRFGNNRCDAVFNNLDEEYKDGSFRLVGFAGTLLTIIVIVCGYFKLPIIPVVFGAAVLATIKRLYSRQWQKKQFGISNGGNADFVNGNRLAYFSLIYLAMCLVEALSYGIGWLVRFITS